MRYYRRNIVLTKRPLQGAFVYRDAFILQPIVRKSVPSSPFAKHYPAYLDYWIDDGEGKTELELVCKDISKTKEICTLLTALSNHEVFTYDSTLKAWGIIAPSFSFDEMTPEEIESVNKRSKNSIWLLVPGYTYDEYKEDRLIKSLSIIKSNKMMDLDPDPFYFTNNPIEDEKKNVSFQKNISDALDTYFSLDEKARSTVYSAMLLIADGLKFGLHHQSLGFISYVSSIETMVELDNKGKKIQSCKECGRPLFSVRKRFLEYLAKYVSRTKSSKKKFDDLYSLRSKIAHTGKLFISDIEFSLLNQEETNKEWFKYVEILQLARLSLYRWLLLNKAVKTE